jgi:hypothetical protein
MGILIIAKRQKDSTAQGTLFDLFYYLYADDRAALFNN